MTPPRRWRPTALEYFGAATQGKVQALKTQQTVRWRALGVTVAALTAVSLGTGCDLVGDAGAKEPGSQSTTGNASTPDKNAEQASPTAEAAEAGGVCEYLDFASLKKATGQPFTIADSGGGDEVTSCVIQTTSGSFPDVTLTKAKTATDTKTYEKKIPPKDHEKVKKLGKTGYSAVRKAVEKSGPVVEIGWLTKGNMYSLRYTTVANTPRAEVDAVVDAMAGIAKDIDKATGGK